MMQPSVAAVVLVMAFACPALGRGEGQQGASSPVRREAGRPGSFTLSVGGELLTPQGLGSTTATMRSNNQQGTTHNYFVTAGNRVAAPAFRGRVGYNITAMFTVEGGLVVSRGNVQGKVSADAENAAPLTVAERMTQYFVDASVLAHLRQLAFSNGAAFSTSADTFPCTFPRLTTRPPSTVNIGVMLYPTRPRNAGAATRFPAVTK